MINPANAADTAAVSVGIGSFLGYAPDIAAALTAIYIAMRIGALLAKWIKKWRKR